MGKDAREWLIIPCALLHHELAEVSSEMAEAKVPDVAGLSSFVPHFHYDLIGRIAPGMYLLLCGYWIIKIIKFKGEVPSLTAAPSFATMVVAVLFAYVVGIIIAPLSNFVFDSLLPFCRFSVKNTPNVVLKAIEQNGWQPPSTTLPKRKWNSQIRSLSELSVYVLWQRAPLLAISTSRLDADAFAARQFGMATIILIAIMAWTLGGTVKGHEPMFITLAGIVFFCYLQFRYSKRRTIISRFVMLRSLAAGSPPDPQAIAAGR